MMNFVRKWKQKMALMLCLLAGVSMGACHKYDGYYFIACYVVNWAAVGGYEIPDEVDAETCEPFSVQTCLDKDWGDLTECCNAIVVNEADPWTPENDPLCKDVLEEGVPTTGDMPEDSTGEVTPTGGTTGDEQDTEGSGGGTGDLPTTTDGSSSEGDSSSTGMPEEQDPFQIDYDPNGKAENFALNLDVTVTRATLDGADAQHPFTDLTVFVRNKDCELINEGEGNTPVKEVALVHLDHQGLVVVEESVPLVDGEVKLAVELYLQTGEIMNTFNVRAVGTKDGTACVGYRSGNPNVTFTGPIPTHTFGAGSAL